MLTFITIWMLRNDKVRCNVANGNMLGNARGLEENKTAAGC